MMKVRLAAQVLSLSVSRVLYFLSKCGPPDAAGIAEFCFLMDTFFDIMNVKKVYAQQFERKSNLVPFSFINDPRFSWLRNVFLQYFKDWLHSVEERQGNFTQNTRQKNFILWQTHEG